MKTNIIYIGADHAGFKLKEQIKKYFKSQKIPFVDVGNTKFDKNDDYPDYAYVLSKRAVNDKTKGILVCGSSYGVCIVANKIKGARAVSIDNTKDAVLSREHNDANILCLSGWKMKSDEAVKIIRAFTKTPNSKAARHQRRLNKIKKLEDKIYK